MAQEEKYLDAIEEAAAPAVTGEGTAETPQEFAAEVEADERASEAAARPAKPDDRPDGFVRKAERDRVQSELQAERQARAVLEDRFNKVLERFQPVQEQPAAEEPDYGPDPDQDPVGALKWQRDQFKARAEAERQWAQHTQQRQQAENQWNEAYSTALTEFAQAKTAEPALQEMYDGLRLSYAKEYQAYGYQLPQIQQLVERQEAQIIQWAHSQGIPITQAIKNLAASRGVAAPQRDLPPRAENGQFTAEAEKAAKIAQSQERNASLGSAPGAPVKKMTASELAKMSEEDMWRYLGSMKHQKGSKEFEREMGFRS